MEAAAIHNRILFFGMKQMIADHEDPNESLMREQALVWASYSRGSGKPDPPQLQVRRIKTKIAGMVAGVKSVRFEGAHCAIALEQLSESLIVMRLSGTDTGEL